MFDVYKIRNDFPMFKNNQEMQGNSFVYLDNASTTFKPNSVIEAEMSYYTTFSVNSHRGDYDIAHSVDTKVAETRANVAKFINADAKEIIFTSGTSMSLNLVAYGYGMSYLKENDEILLTQAEHASNILPWFKVAEETGAVIKYIPLEDGKLTIENLKKSITKNTKIICIAHITNVLGYVLDIKEITKIAHEHGIIVCVDGAQSVPHLKTDVKDLDVDFLSFSAHKMCGPTGIGILYGKYDLLKIMKPFMTGGGMNARFDMCGEVAYLEPPFKFEAGTQNLAGIYGLNECINYLNNLGMENINKYEKELRKYAISKLENNKNITIYNKDAESGIITFNYKGVFAQDEATLLNRKGICVRSGQHCAKILTDVLGTDATVRASIYFYNTKEDIDALVSALEKGGDFLDAYFDE